MTTDYPYLPRRASLILQPDKLGLPAAARVRLARAIEHTSGRVDMEHLSSAEGSCIRALPCFYQLDVARQITLVELFYHFGNIESEKFTNYLRLSLWQEATDELPKIVGGRFREVLSQANVSRILSQLRSGVIQRLR